MRLMHLHIFLPIFRPMQFHMQLNQLLMYWGMQVMSLQKFKLDVANAVVNQDNVSLGDMDTGRLLDLFGKPGEAGRCEHGLYSHGSSMSFKSPVCKAR